MSKKPVEVFQSKITRNDRFAQMSHQEKVIEQKKKEIQARLEQKQKVVTTTETKTTTITTTTTTSSTSKPAKSMIKVQDKKAAFNTFSNDGSFLDQFKQMKDKKIEQKLKSFKSRESDKSHSDERGKTSRWSQPRSPKESRLAKPRISRFSDKPTFEPKINITTTYSNLLSQPNFEQISTQNVMGQPLLKNHSIPPPVPYPQTSESVIVAPPVLLNMPPPQIIQSSMASIVGTTTILTTDVSSLITPTTVLTSVNLAPPLPPQTILQEGVATTSVITVQPNIELASIPPPTTLQIHNIPQPDSINMIPQNITQTVQLNEIPKPLDLLNIPTPNDCLEQNIADAEFIKNIPPPNKSIPPPTLPENLNLTIPPPTEVNIVPTVPTCLPPPNILPPQNILVQTIPPPQITQITVQNLAPPPPPPPPQQTLMQTLALQGQVPVGVPPPPSNSIPSLMAQPVLPPPGMGIVPPMNMSCPPPMLQATVSCSIIQPPPPVFVTQPPPMVSQMPPMNIPPPTTITMGQTTMIGNYNDMNTVFPPGTADYEAMASLGRMVAQCGPGIEDVVCQRKTQDPSLWFLFHKESAAYRQYQQLVEQFTAEMAESKRDDNFYKPEDTYEQDSVDDEYTEKRGRTNSDGERMGKRKRKSRWGDKTTVVSPPAVVPMQPKILSPGGVLISKITRTDPGLVQYAINTFGSSNLTEEDWKKAEDHYKINILYQEMVRKRQEVERLRIVGRNKYEYDSDEETDGGTWEHKLREKEMFATQQWANELTRQSEGKHHIGDFLPPEELKKFMEKSTAIKDGRQPSLSDYKEFKLKEDNIGFKMLQKLGWSEGQGLGSNSTGIVEPVNKGSIRDQNQGLGLDQPDQIDDNDDEYESYRKRMMLAYRFRPNPLNNPRRPYY